MRRSVPLGGSSVGGGDECLKGFEACGDSAQCTEGGTGKGNEDGFARGEIPKIGVPEAGNGLLVPGDVVPGGVIELPEEDEVGVERA